MEVLKILTRDYKYFIEGPESFSKCLFEEDYKSLQKIA